MLKKNDIKYFTKCPVVEILDFKSIVDEIYGPRVFEKTVGEDIAMVEALIELENISAAKGEDMVGKSTKAIVGIDQTKEKMSF